MIAMIRKLQINPAKRDKDNEIVKDESAIVTLEFPMDTEAQRAGIKNLFDMLAEEYVSCNIDHENSVEVSNVVEMR